MARSVAQLRQLAAQARTAAAEKSLDVDTVLAAASKAALAGFRFVRVKPEPLLPLADCEAINATLARLRSLGFVAELEEVWLEEGDKTNPTGSRATANVIVVKW